MSEFFSSYEAKIDIPNWMFKEMQTACDFSMDIGGTLVKVAYLSKTKHNQSYKMSDIESNLMSDSQYNTTSENRSEDENKESGYSLHFVKFQTLHIELSLDFIQKNLLRKTTNPAHINCTGGGAYKFKNLIHSKLGLNVEKIDEMKSLIHGCVFVLSNIKFESFAYVRDDPSSPYKFIDQTGKNIFPFLLVNIGSGVSIIKVESKDKFTRIGGTSLGGGTFLGLGSVLTSAKTFEELLSLASKGQPKNIDLLVKDIFGGSYDELNLPGDLIASSFAKASRFKGRLNDLYQKNVVSPGDIAKSLLHMISNEIGQIASLYGRIEGLNTIYFGGNFVRNNPITMHTITFAVNHFSKGTQSAIFLRHDGYLGSIGCLFMRESYINSYSWHEDTKVRLLLVEGRRFPYLHFNSATTLRCNKKKFLPFPLISILPTTTSPTATTTATNTEISLSLSHNLLKNMKTGYSEQISHLPGQYFDKETFFGSHNTEYWFKYLTKNIQLLIDNEIIQYNEEHTNFRDALDKLSKQDLINIQGLIDLKEQFLSEFFLPAPFLKFKTIQNNDAINLFKDEIDRLDQINTISERMVAIFLNIFTGNFFDVGSNEFLEFLLEKKSLPFYYIRSIVQKKLKMVENSIILFGQYLKLRKWEKISIFVDNSGYDLILGIFPLVREFLKNKIQVVLISNSYSALNDVMFPELNLICDRIEFLCPIIADAVSNGQLKLAQTGLGSPCLDLRLMESDSIDMIKDSDLIILEGPYKTLLMSEKVCFLCSSLRLGTVTFTIPEKTKQEIFDLFFLYEPKDLNL